MVVDLNCPACEMVQSVLRHQSNKEAAPFEAASLCVAFFILVVSIFIHDQSFHQVIHFIIIGCVNPFKNLFRIYISHVIN